MKNPAIKFLLGLFVVYIVLTAIDFQPLKERESKQRREHVEKFCDTGVFTDLIKNNNGKVLQYGYLENGNTKDAILIEVQFKEEYSFSQIEKIISEFTRKKHFNWSIAHDWIKTNGAYTISYYETGLDIFITYTYISEFPNKIGIGVSTYTEAKEQENK